MMALAQDVQKLAAIFAKMLKDSAHAAVSNNSKEGLTALTYHAATSHKVDVFAKTTSKDAQTLT